MRTVIKKETKQVPAIQKVVVNKELDKIKTVSFTSDKLEEVNKYNIVIKP